MRMFWEKGVLHSLGDQVDRHNLLTSAQGACRPHKQTFDTIYTLLSYIQFRKRTLRQPTYVFFGDITLAFPSVFREQLLLRLRDYGISEPVWQHLRALHHTLKLRVLHGYNPATAYIPQLKGLPEGTRLSPLLWGLYIADLVTSVCVSPLQMK